MSRVRDVLGLIAGTILVLSSGAHSFLGWPALRAALVAARAPDDLIRGLAIGWHFGGASMLAFGVMVLAIFLGRLRGSELATWPAAVVAILYVAFGVAALVASNFELFFLIFVVPGSMLAVASRPTPRASTP
jgi:hypothetical protein